ncbi:MAG: DNA mismatch repair endonuclease MutL [Desulfobacterales bacterium]|nr:DNA mismatch repair endonuclease MutL [Desulfobacterales bacterium]
MANIRILPDILSNKIAAGEVVERPSAVVKELVENSIDAESSRIMIDVEQGGRSLIRVSDNGMGMRHDDALLALERFATSKIHTDSDLFSISTLGFRGEALPSIAAVSNFSMITKDRASDSGTEIIVDGGKINKVSEAGAPAGTMITVKNLFYNIPARRKFLKTVNTEMGHITEAVASMALSRPDIHFQITHNNKTIKNWTPVSQPLNRIAEVLVLGNDLRDNLHRIEFEDNQIAVSGWTSSPRINRSSPKGIYIFVNGRFIRDRGIQRALFEGYRGRLMKNNYPVSVLFINIAPSEIDVNVHPTKHEIRFSKQNMVLETISSAVSDIWQKVEKPKWNAPGEPVNRKTDIKETENIESLFSSDTEKDIFNSDSQKQFIKTDFHEKTKTASYNSFEKNTGFFETVTRYEKPAPAPVTINKKITSKQETHSKQAPIWETSHFKSLRLIGQIHGTYILCESKEGLVIIDQHAAHERILFEQLKQKSSSKNRIQKLLIPETFDVGFTQVPILEKMLPDLNTLGIEIEPFGGNTFAVKSIPVLLGNREVKPLVIEIVEKTEEDGFSPGFEKTIEECLILMACHGAIRAHQVLSDKQIQSLLEQLDECENPSYCPHGRPTWIKLSLKDLEKDFNRIV